MGRGKPPERPPATQSTYTPKPRFASPGKPIGPGEWLVVNSEPFAELLSRPKRDYVRSAALMRSYGMIPCQNCGADDGTICGAHSNWSEHGKGGHIKADDSRAASLCAACHIPLLDQGALLTREQRKALWWSAHIRTVIELRERGLWPAEVPFPDIEASPF